MTHGIVPHELYCVVFPADDGRDRIGSTNVFDGVGAEANGIMEDPDFNPIAELDAKLRMKVYVPAEERDLLKPKFLEQFEGDSAEWNQYFTSDSTSRMVKPFEILAYQKALLLSAGKLIGDDAYEVCLTSYVHRWFLEPVSQITLELVEAKCYINKEQELPVLMRTIEDDELGPVFPFWPRSGVRLEVEKFPIILTEIDSGAELDENRLMLQAAYLSKVASLAQKRITIMAIYFSKDRHARIYLVASDPSYKVKYSRREILVDNIFGVVELMFMVFNFTSYASGVKDQLASTLFKRVAGTIKDASRNLPSRTTLYSNKREVDSDEPSGAKKPRAMEQDETQSGRKHAQCSSSLAHHGSPCTLGCDLEPFRLVKRRRIDVEGTKTVAHRTLSVDALVDPVEPVQLDDGEKAKIAEVLDQEGVQIFLDNDVAVLPPPLFCGQLGDGRLVAIKVTKREEVSIHSMLSRVINPSPHIIPLLGHCHAFGELHLLITPLRTPLKQLDYMDHSLLHSKAVLLMTQLLQATAFIHRNYVAHLDIRPDNLVLNGKGFLEVIDFGLAVYVASVNDQLRGFRGYAPWVAPEVKADEHFQPFAADLYACGRVIRHYSAFFAAGDGEWLVEASVGLMGEAASRTSVMGKVLKSLNTKVPQYGIA